VPGGYLLVHLAPAPVVARVATLTGTRRAGDDWLRREASVAGFLARSGAPVVAPSAELDPGPHTHDGISLSFWEYIEEVDAPLDAAEAGHGLRACHELLAGYEGALEPLGTLAEAERWLEEMATEGRIGAEQAAALRRDAAEVRRGIEALGLPMQPAHGDAHLDNVINTAAGPTGRTPAWRHERSTSVVSRRRLRSGETTPSRSRQPLPPTAIDAEVLAVFVAARRFQGTMWSVLLD